MSFLTARANLTVNASAAALAWVNAFHATSQDPLRPVLFRTLSVEIFATGVQFIATSGSILFRTWVPTLDEKGEAYPWPGMLDVPESSVVVMDAQHFALNFIKALAGAAKQFEVAELSMTVEDAPEMDAEVPVLGDSFSKDVLTLRAFGQQMHCQLLEDKYPNWRKLEFGIDKAERVDGMTVSTSMLATIGKLKGVRSVDMTFTGETKQINLQGSYDSFRGLLMPMERREKDKPQPDPEADDEQTDALADTTIKIDGKWVPATKENMEKVVRSQMSGRRNRAAGKGT